MARVDGMTAKQRVVAKILIEDWDPIGVNDVPECQDEYAYGIQGWTRGTSERVAGICERQNSSFLP